MLGNMQAIEAGGFSRGRECEPLVELGRQRPIRGSARHDRSSVRIGVGLIQLERERWRNR